MNSQSVILIILQENPTTTQSFLGTDTIAAIWKFRFFWHIGESISVKHSGGLQVRQSE